MKKQFLLRGIALILCFALLLPCTAALAAGETPALTLICPSETGSAAVPDQRLIWQSSVPVTAQANKLISIQQKDTENAAVYTIPANSGSVTVSGGTSGPWMISVALNSLKGTDDAAFAAEAEKAYRVTVPYGAFQSTADGVPCDETSATFTLSAGGDAQLLITYTLPGAGWKVEAVGSDGSRTNVPNGAAVGSGTSLSVSGSVALGMEALQSVTTPSGTTELTKLSGDAFDLTVTADTHILVTLRQAALSGSATIAQTASELVCSYSGAADMTDVSHLQYTFYCDDAAIEGTGTNSNAYTPPADSIGKDFYAIVTSSLFSGSVKSNTLKLGKPANPATPPAPVVTAQTSTSITLKNEPGCEYSRDGAKFQTGTEFTGLEPKTEYTFYQRYAETDTMLASSNSDSVKATTGAPALTGTVSFSEAPRVGRSLTATLANTNNSGTLSYKWYSGSAYADNRQSYTPSTDDIGKTLTVEITSSVETGTITATTAAVGKSIIGAPTAPALQSVSTTSVTLVAVHGCEYSMDNSRWQDSPTFNNLTSGQTYAFYQRYKATDMQEASAASQASFTTSVVTGLTGAIQVSGDVRYGKTLVASLTGSNATGALTYTWYRGATAVGSGAYYDVNSADIGYPLYVQVVSAGLSGSITKLVGTVQKAEYVGLTPTAPTRESRSTSRVTLTLHAGYEYSRDGHTWQSSNVFSGLSAGKTYKFYQRIAATASMDASPASDALTTSTSSASGSSSSGSSSSGSSSSGSSSSGSSSGSGGDTDSGGDNAPSGVGALYTYSATGDSSRILFSTMERLVTGNKTQDVTITSGNVQFRFFKGTMQLSTGALWYDFGTEVNGAELTAAAKAIAGDSVVATIRFNHSGELPAKANIRIALDSSQAGKALYYYRIADGALTYIQTAIADISGAVTVVQSSCSDYVFLDRDFFAEEATPAPSPDATASPTPLMAEDPGSSKNGGGWFLALVIIVALLLIVAGIIFYIKSRQSNSFDDFDIDPDDGPDGNDGYGFLEDDYGSEYDDYDGEPLPDDQQQAYEGYDAAPQAEPSAQQNAFLRHDAYASPAYTAQQSSAVYTPAAPPASPGAYATPQAVPQAAPRAETPLETVKAAQYDPSPAADAVRQPEKPSDRGQYPRARYRP